MIKFYSNECPVCKEVRALMDIRNIDYEYINNKETVDSIAQANNIMQAPFAEVDGVVMNTIKFRKYLNALKDKE